MYFCIKIQSFQTIKKMHLNLYRKLKINYLWSLIIWIFLIFNACEQQSKKEAAIEALDVVIEIDRFDRKFHNAGPEEIPNLKSQYPFLFPQQFEDSIWIKRQKDSLQLLLQSAVEAKYPGLGTMEYGLSNLFKHIKYYFPSTKVPQTIGLINNVDYQSKAIYTDSLLLISLDTYLGKEHELYEGIPNYVRKQMDAAYLTSHVAEKFITSRIQEPDNRTFLSQLIYYGKIEYIKALLLPEVAEAIRLGFSEAELQWTLENQKYIWQYFIEKQFLYSTDPALIQRFLAPAPFSKFYLEIDNETPGRIGIWLGSQIVNAFVSKNPQISLEELLALPALTLFQQSNYKPSR